MKRLRGYNAIICAGNDEFAKYRQINNLERFFEFVEKRFPEWRFMWIYRRVDNARILLHRHDIDSAAEILIKAGFY